MEHVLHGVYSVDAPTGRGTFGVSGQLKRIGFWGLGKMVSCAKTRVDRFYDLYIV